ncbi:hypothetical protein BDV38DRAFT_264632 [Aspergillus pseudotamarii]|uniref:Uncharacterized protein n=1 Tax=Aspergillus pseudotamarii TaxID=132259 RepID=A0A5N6S9J4_ASPPS|nr:uncharacterized protein BDV38DRAFT_264632 [Aspergillus pseudotamarii]KAE8131386.1 hypothetical protein BDV38DRAFT_264632 [Aspergillus pseudotamarii]
MRFAASISWSIDPWRPYRLDNTSCVNQVPRVRALQEHVRKRKQIRDGKKRAYDSGRRIPVKT